MGLTLPGELERLLNDLGFTWPEVDETELFEVGNSWLGFASALGGSASAAQSAAQQVAALNQGAAVDAFLAKWSGEHAPAAVLRDAGTGVELGGAAVLMCAGLVLGLKVNTIVNLTILLVEIASAIAEAFVTFGASLAEIPVFKEITQRFINALVNEVVMAVLG